MTIFLQGPPADCLHFKTLCDEHGSFVFAENHLEHTIADAMLASDPHAAVVLSGGAAGMEAAMIIRRLYPTLPLLWFSDDNAFGVQAYRLDVTYFADKARMKERLGCALTRAGLLAV